MRQILFIYPVLYIYTYSMDSAQVPASMSVCAKLGFLNVLLHRSIDPAAKLQALYPRNNCIGQTESTLMLCSYLTILLLALFIFAVAGCDNEGPAQQAGENIDEAVEPLKAEVEDARQSLEENTQ